MTTLMTGNVAFVSVYVPRGHHRVRVVYRPESFVRGHAISAATIIVLAAFAMLCFGVRRPRLRFG